MKWISVKERLPEEYEDVLILYLDDDECPEKEFAIAYFMPTSQAWDTDHCSAYVNLDEATVTHWQPLPELPKDSL